MRSIVCKFGGTSLADSEQIRKVKEIVESDSRRRFLVPSAPGKRSLEDMKVTDLLYRCHELVGQKLDVSELIGQIGARYQRIVEDLELGLDIDGFAGSAP